MGVSMYFGLSPGEWQVFGIVAGVVIAILGFVTNTFFQWLRYRKGI